ncbi:MAG TPA: universal stress protein [Phycisphaerales bacterium]|nr:universal stress protein [Phycisphaerales bacterium]HMP37849.1 universal stress protein [Phycisphaerales bacterium]
MPQLASIVVGVDFSPCSAAALAQAWLLAKRSRAAIHVLHVVRREVVRELALSLGRTVEQVSADLIDGARRQLESFVAGQVGSAGAREGSDASQASRSSGPDRPSEPPIPSAPDQAARRAGGPGARAGVSASGDSPPAEVRLHVEVGDPVDAIVARCAEIDASLLVLGVYGEGGSGMGSGHVSLAGVRHAPCSTLLVHERTRRPLRAVLAAVDFAPESLIALDFASRVAEVDGALLRLLHVHYAPWHRLHYRAPTEESSPEFQRQYLDRLRGLVDDLAERERALHPGLRVEIDLVDDPSPGRAILDAAEGGAADLIALGTRRDGRIRKFFIGSNAERVLRNLDVSVIVGRTPPARQGEGR